ncbi:MAG: methionine ABC transporter ATP-binding protein [Eubacteriales bacterium]|nr:methionine ABC transporter ATP-binding protein [Eubacteriales bacterium]
MIEIRGLKKAFGELTVLEDINLTINDGEIYGLVGRSGAGKSTLLRCINGLEKYESGSILVDNVEVKNLDRKGMRNFRKSVSMIFQHFPMLTRKTVYENIAFPMRCWGYDKSTIDKRVKELAELVGITDKLNQRPRELSGGQQQRVAIARALTMEPKVLLSDEATSALDPVTTRSILQLLRDINEKLGITIIIVTHQMSVIKDICEKVTLLDHGKLVVSGPVDELFMNQPEELKTFLGEEQFHTEGEGINIQIMMSDDNDSKKILSKMSRELDVDFVIINSEMERYRDKYLGYLIINVEEKYKERVERYLNGQKILWRYYEMANGEEM